MNIKTDPQWKSWVIKFVYQFLKYTVGVLIRLIWVREVTGLENIPRNQAVIIAANHESLFDFLCLIAISPRHIRFLAGEKMFANYFLQSLMKLTGQFKVDRRIRDKSQLRTEVATALKNKEAVGIFPEGTRTRNGQMLKAFTGVARFAIEHEVPIIPIGINGAYETMSANDKFPKFNKQISITIGEPILLSNFYQKTPSRDTLQRLTNDIMTTISKLANKNYPYKN